MSDQAIEDWSGEVGHRWLDNLDSFEEMIAPAGQALIAKAAFQPGERIIDVGCGGGANSRDIARIVGPSGHVCGIDIAPQLVAEASRRAAAEGLSNVDFQLGDAQNVEPAGQPFDRLYSRFGVMFFSDTFKAFSHMRGWLKPAGKLSIAVWAPPAMNPWMGLIAQTVGKYVDLPQRDPDGPGPFRLSDADATRAMLERAGWRQVECELWQGEQHLGGAGADPEGAVDFVLGALSMREPLDRVGGEPLVEQVRSELVEVVSPYYRDGAVRMEASAWLLSARSG